MNLEGFEVLYVSFCLMNRICIKFALCDNEAVVIFGSEYAKYIDSILAAEKEFHLDYFGCALSEPNRVEILNLMHMKNEITIKDIEQSMKISGTWLVSKI